MTVLLAVTAIVGFVGCDYGYLLRYIALFTGGKFADTRPFEPISVTPDELEIPADGTSPKISVIIALDGDFIFGLISTFDVTFLGPDGLPVAGVEATPLPNRPNSSPQFQMDLQVENSVLPQAITVQMTVHGTYTFGMNSDLDQQSHRSTSFPLYLHRAGEGPAPRIADVSPASLPRGAATPVVISGLNLTAATTLLAEEPITVGENPVFDAGTGTITATLTLPAAMPTGSRRLYVKNGDTQSYEFAVEVYDPVAPPVLGALFPNYGFTRLDADVALVGTGFAPGMSLLTSLHVLRDPVVEPPYFAKSLLEITGEPRIENLRVDTTNGASGTVPFHVVARDFPGPRIVSVTPDTLQAGTQNQVLLELQNVDPASAGQTVELHAVPTEVFAQPITAARVLSAPAGSRRVSAVVDTSSSASGGYVQLGAKVSSLAGGPVYHTPLRRIYIEAPPGGTTPFLRRAQTGSVAREQTVTETIHGENLTGLTALRFNVPTVTAQIVSIAQDGRSLTANIHATENAPLTSSALTVLRGVYGRNMTNPIAYVVQEGGGGAPSLDLLAPNWAYENDTVNLYLNGNGFSGSEEVGFAPDQGVSQEALRLQDERNAQVAVTFSQASTNYTVTVTGGDETFGSKPFRVLDSTTENGPLVRQTGAPQITAGVLAQVEINGDFLAEGGVPTLIQLPKENDPISVTSSRFFPVQTSGHLIDGVLEVQLQLSINDGAARSARFALRRADGLVSTPFSIEATPAIARRPLIRSLSTPTMHRGQTVIQTITGQNLQGITEIYPAFSGLTATITTPPNSAGTSMKARFELSATADLTGDEVTTFLLYKPSANAGSNQMSLIVEP